MQLGTRWTSGDEPPSSVPPAVVAAIRSVDATFGSSGPRPRWTLTWLEGLPVVELDDGTTIRLDGDDVLVTRED